MATRRTGVQVADHVERVDSSYPSSSNVAGLLLPRQDVTYCLYIRNLCGFARAQGSTVINHLLMASWCWRAPTSHLPAYLPWIIFNSARSCLCCEAPLVDHLTDRFR